MNATEPRAPAGGTGADPPVGTWLLVVVLASGMVAWMVHLVGASALVPAACEHGVPWTIDALTAGTALVCAAGIVGGVVISRRANAGTGSSEGLRLLGYVAVLANLASLLLVLGEGAMHIWIDACR